MMKNDAREKNAKTRKNEIDDKMAAKHKKKETKKLAKKDDEARTQVKRKTEQLSVGDEDVERMRGTTENTPGRSSGSNILAGEGDRDALMADEQGLKRSRGDFG